MILKSVICGFAFLAANAMAVPLQYSTTSQTNSAVAMNADMADYQSVDAPPLSLPLITSAVAVGDTDFASAGAINASGLLSASTEASSGAGYASASATAEFKGSFQGAPSVRFKFQFGSTSEVSNAPGTFSGATLFVNIMNGGTTLYSNLFVDPGQVAFTIELPSSTQSTFSVLLESAASVTAGGYSFNQADVAFSASPVPEPATVLLFALGVAALMLVVSRRHTAV